MKPWARPGTFTRRAAVLQQLPAAVRRHDQPSASSNQGPRVSLIDDDIVIVGPAGRLSYRFPTGPGTDWRDYSVRLSASEGWTWNWNARATEAQLESVLAAANPPGDPRGVRDGR